MHTFARCQFTIACLQASETCFGVRYTGYTGLPNWCANVCMAIGSAFLADNRSLCFLCSTPTTFSVACTDSLTAEPTRVVHVHRTRVWPCMMHDWESDGSQVVHHALALRSTCCMLVWNKRVVERDRGVRVSHAA